MNLYQYSTFLAKTAFQSSCLQLMFNKKISRECLKFYVAQKLQISKNFQGLLAAGIEKSKNLGDYTLASVLEKNLLDEQGIDSNGIVHPENAHLYWLDCFLKAFDMNRDKPVSQPLPAAEAHSRCMFALEEGDALKIAGALLMIERIVPLEYRAVQKSRDYYFPESFVDSPEDTIALQQQKKLARKYIDDHVVHDAAEHFPALLRELEKYQTNQKALSQIKEGMQILTEARLAFFDEVATAWSGLYDGQSIKNSPYQSFVDGTSRSTTESISALG